MTTYTERFAAGAATEADLKVALWQLERMDYIGEREPVLADACALLDSLDGEIAELSAAQAAWHDRYMAASAARNIH